MSVNDDICVLVQVVITMCVAQAIVTMCVGASDNDDIII